jgi:hypothetical protein
MAEIICAWMRASLWKPPRDRLEDISCLAGLSTEQRAKGNQRYVSAEAASARNCQSGFEKALGLLRFQITTRATFNRPVGVDPDTPTDMQSAARLLYLQRMT